MNLFLVILLLILIIIYFIYIDPIIFKHKIKNNNEYGSARFASFNEIKKNFKKEKINNIKEVGVPIWFDKRYKYVWFDKETPHYIYLGSSGSGKSVTSVIPLCSFISSAKVKRSVFVTDPKGEIFHLTSKMFKENGYNIITLDFRNPELSNHINILEPIIDEYDKYILYEKKSIESLDEKEKLKYKNMSIYSYAETNRLINSLASMITYEKSQGKDPFWNNSAKNLLEGLIGFFLEEYKEGKIDRKQITMTSIRKFQNSTMEEINAKQFKNYIETKKYGTKSKDSLVPILSSSENTYKSITSVFSEKMSIFDDVNVSNITSTSDFKFNVLGSERTVLYVIVPDEDKTYNTLVTIIVGLLYKELVKLANKYPDKKLPIQIDWILDEFANCPPLADIEAIVSVARSRGMRFHFFIQSLSQLDNVYGKEVAQIILDNSGLQYLKTNTMQTAEAVSKMLGQQTLESKSISQSISLNNFNGNQSTSLMSRALLTPDEIKNLHYKTIIFPNIGYPIFRDTVIYKKFSCYSNGEVDRKINPLKDLNDTYFTVEQIKIKQKNNDEETTLYNEIKDLDKNRLQPAINIIKGILKSKIKTFEFKTENGRTYVSFIIDGSLNQKEIAIIKGKINKEKYQLNMNLKEIESIIELHLKGLFETNLYQAKGVTNNV